MKCKSASLHLIKGSGSGVRHIPPQPPATSTSCCVPHWTLDWQPKWHSDAPSTADGRGLLGERPRYVHSVRIPPAPTRRGTQATQWSLGDPFTAGQRGSWSSPLLVSSLRVSQGRWPTFLEGKGDASHNGFFICRHVSRGEEKERPTGRLAPIFLLLEGIDKRQAVGLSILLTGGSRRRGRRETDFRSSRHGGR